MLLAIVLSGIFSMQAQEIEGTQSQSQRTIAEQPRKVTDWSEQPIGIVYGGIGVGHIISAEEGAARTGVDWRIGMSRYYNQWGWGVLLQQLTAWQNTYISNSQQTVKMKDTNRLLYLAPQFTARKMLGKQLTMYGAIGWGWLHYKGAVNLEGFGQFNAKANALGGNISVGLEYRLGKRAGLSVDAGLIEGKIGKPKVDNAVLQEVIDEAYTGKMNASRLFATVGVHIYIWKH